ncbi:xanthine dehydrogenase accessory protein XdhC [Alphaproteobacteria bacterium LSUCC0684]
MIPSWTSALRDLLAEGGVAVLVTVIEARGSTPREEGAWLALGRKGFIGTIGGGALEYDAMARAGKLLDDASPWRRMVIDQPLGPGLGQCCGGHVRLLFERVGVAEMAELDRLKEDVPTFHPLQTGLPVSQTSPQHRDEAGAVYHRPKASLPRPLFVYGAGHVGRALMAVTGDLGFARVWVDISRDRFPPTIADDIDVFVAPDPGRAAAHAPDGALHLVMTHDHALDQQICEILMRKARFGFLGLIGSDTKRMRFLRRLSEAGIDQAVLERLVCPVGIRSVEGKDPARVALSIAAQLASM